MSAINLKSDLTYVDAQLANILNKTLNYDIIETSTITLILKSHITDVDTSCQAIINRFQYYETILGSYIKSLTKSYKLTTYLNTDADVFYLFYKLEQIGKL